MFGLTLLGKTDTYFDSLASKVSRNSLTCTKLSGNPMLKLCSANMCLNKMALYNHIRVCSFHTHVRYYLFSHTILQKRHLRGAFESTSRSSCWVLSTSFYSHLSMNNISSIRLKDIPISLVAYPL